MTSLITNRVVVGGGGVVAGKNWKNNCGLIQFLNRRRMSSKKGRGQPQIQLQQQFQQQQKNQHYYQFQQQQQQRSLTSYVGHHHRQSVIIGTRCNTIRYFSKETTSQTSNPTTTTATATATTIVPALPNAQQLRIVAFRAAIPMIGFGFMDNLVMITAGDAIDSTFGVALGISTLTAAGFGQCCSDVAGITCGGIVDATVAKLNLPKHGLTQAQLDLKSTRMYSTFGACVGVLMGCLLGMSILLFMDTDRADREKRAKELQSIFESIMSEGHKLVECKRATLFMVDEDKQELWSRVATGNKGKVIKTSIGSGLVGVCVTTGETINVANAYTDPRFNPDVDKSTGYKTKSVLCMPVKDDHGKIIGAVQMINKQAPDGSIGVFGKADEKLVAMLASHVTSFIRIVDSNNDDD